MHALWMLQKRIVCSCQLAEVHTDSAEMAGIWGCFMRQRQAHNSKTMLVSVLFYPVFSVHVHASCCRFPSDIAIRKGRIAAKLLCSITEKKNIYGVTHWYETFLWIVVESSIHIQKCIHPPSQNICTFWLLQSTFDHSSYSKSLCKCKNNYDILKIYMMIKYVIAK
jgi:hypothetical protein